MSKSEPTLAIIGAGYSGLMMADQLQQQCPELRLKLIDPRQPHGRGVAYWPIAASYLLNVPANRMGALANDPEHFWHWLQTQFPDQYQPEDYVPRTLYGDYLAHLLARLQQRTAVSKRFEAVFQAVVGIAPDAGQFRLQLANQECLWADRVVLATGNQLPANPKLESDDFVQWPRYFQNPWQSSCLEGLDSESPVLLLGSGLTMVDLVLGLRETGFGGQIIAISPHGYIPVAHRPGPLWPDYVAAYLEDHPWPQSLMQWLHLVRQQMQLADSAGRERGAVTDVLRSYTPRIWQTLSLKDRQRFLAHLRHRLGVLRHRLPALCAEKLQRELTAGTLNIHAGRVLDLQLDNSQARVAQVHWRPRLQQSRQVLTVQRVINCTGPNGDYQQLKQPLYSQLFEQGLLQADPLGLGLMADPDGALLDCDGKPSGQLFALGPPLRGRDWESTAVPEIRVQVAQLTRVLLASLA